MRKRITLAWLVLFCLVAIVSGCANLNYQSPVGASAKANPQKAYLYGRFSLERDFLNHVRLALQLEDQDSGQTVSIRLRDDRPVYAIQVDPGTYQMKGLVYALVGAVMDWETSKIALPAQPAYLSNPIAVKPGKAYYLGDFHGTSRRTGFGLAGPMVWATFKGGLVGVQQNFPSTTEALKHSVPQFADLDFQSAW